MVVAIAAPFIPIGSNPSRPKISIAFSAKLTTSPSRCITVEIATLSTLRIMFRYISEKVSGIYVHTTMRRYFAPSAMTSGSLVNSRIICSGNTDTTTVNAADTTSVNRSAIPITRSMVTMSFFPQY